jgi:hypothetical protein
MEETKVTKIDKKTVEEAIEFILEEGKELGYQEAVRIYAKNYKDLIKKGRRQGIVIGALTTILAFQTIKKIKNDMREKIKEEEKSKQPFEVHINDVKETDYDEEE